MGRRHDLYFPKQKKDNHPLVIFIHGGGWGHGKKEHETDFAMFFDKNFGVQNIEYRLATKAVAPAAIEDTRCALDFLVNQASAYNINPKNRSDRYLCRRASGITYRFDSEK